MVAVGISGATGCIYGIRLLEALRALGQETELILSDWGAETIRLETDLTVEQVKALADRVWFDYSFQNFQGHPALSFIMLSQNYHNFYNFIIEK